MHALSFGDTFVEGVQPLFPANSLLNRAFSSGRFRAGRRHSFVPLCHHLLHSDRALDRIAELEREHHHGHAMEVLKQNALDLARQIDELRSVLVEQAKKTKT